MEKPRAVAPRALKQVQRALRADQRRLDRVALVMDRRGRTGEIVDLVETRQRLGHRVQDVVLQKMEARAGLEMRDIGAAPGVEIVEAHDLVPLPDQPLAQMRTEEAGAAGDEHGGPAGERGRDDG
jgi:hypothetical protein